MTNFVLIELIASRDSDLFGGRLGGGLGERHGQDTILHGCIDLVILPLSSALSLVDIDMILP
jgi:hypothetical protein